jgi:hypothetical protein
MPDNRKPSLFDDATASRGVMIGCALGAAIWMVIGLLAWLL